METLINVFTSNYLGLVWLHTVIVKLIYDKISNINGSPTLQFVMLVFLPVICIMQLLSRSISLKEYSIQLLKDLINFHLHMYVM